MLRATQRYLGLLPDTTPDLSEDYVLPERVIVESPARAHLIHPPSSRRSSPETRRCMEGRDTFVC